MTTTNDIPKEKQVELDILLGNTNRFDADKDIEEAEKFKIALETRADNFKKKSKSEVTPWENMKEEDRNMALLFLQQNSHIMAPTIGDKDLGELAMQSEFGVPNNVLKWLKSQKTTPLSRTTSLQHSPKRRATAKRRFSAPNTRPFLYFGKEFGPLSIYDSPKYDSHPIPNELMVWLGRFHTNSLVKTDVSSLLCRNGSSRDIHYETMSSTVSKRNSISTSGSKSQDLLLFPDHCDECFTHCASLVEEAKRNKEEANRNNNRGRGSPRKRANMSPVTKTTNDNTDALNVLNLSPNSLVVDVGSAMGFTSNSGLVRSISLQTDKKQKVEDTLVRSASVKVTGDMRRPGSPKRSISAKTAGSRTSRTSCSTNYSGDGSGDNTRTSSNMSGRLSEMTESAIPVHGGTGNALSNVNENNQMMFMKGVVGEDKGAKSNSKATCLLM